MLIKMWMRTSRFIERYARPIGWIMRTIAVLCGLGLWLIYQSGESNPTLALPLILAGIFTGLFSWGMLSPSVGRQR